MTLGRSGFGGVSICFQPMKAGAGPRRLETWEPASPFYCGLGGSSKAIKNHSLARSISSSSQKFSALQSALCELRPPLRPCGLDTRHTLHQPGRRAFSFPPRRVTVSRGSARLVHPLTQPYQLRSENSRDKNLNNHDYLDRQAHSLSVADLYFMITFVVMITG
jgi:hypothetical protein